MREFENNALFWQKLDSIYLSGDFKVTYRKGERHPANHNMIFPCDYGHIETVNNDQDEKLKVLKGEGTTINAVVVCANILDKNLNVIALVGIEGEDLENVLEFLNSNDYQKTVLIRRGNDIPDWAVND